MNSVQLDYYKKQYEEVGQGHVFRFFYELSDPMKHEFLDRVASIDLDYMCSLIPNAISAEAKKEDIGNLMPVKPFCLSLEKENSLNYSKILQCGEKALRAGTVGALLVAGGQGTRLGFDGPKGIFPITPIKKKSFFQVFAEKIKDAQERYESVIPWYIMVSEFNAGETLHFFDQNDRFGLEEVHFFKQGMIPSIDFNGKFLLDETGLIAMAPDGHGGCFEALLKSGLISKMEKGGIDVISYFQVDNPLVKCIDPFFIGLHITSGSEMSSKIVKKTDPMERVGLFCREGDHLRVVEYSDASEEMLKKRNENGDLVFNAASIAVHLLDLQFIKTMGVKDGLGFHRAKKEATFLDSQKRVIVPNEPNAIKFEKLIFDALARAKNSILLEVAREEEFSPVKNAEGKDSPASCKKDMLRQCVRWLKAANIDIACSDQDLPVFDIEISPLFADTEEAFVAKWRSLDKKLEVTGQTYLENDCECIIKKS